MTEEEQQAVALLRALVARKEPLVVDMSKPQEQQLVLLLKEGYAYQMHKEGTTFEVQPTESGKDYLQGLDGMIASTNGFHPRYRVPTYPEITLLWGILGECGIDLVLDALAKGCDLMAEEMKQKNEPTCLFRHWHYAAMDLRWLSEKIDDRDLGDGLRHRVDHDASIENSKPVA